MNDQLIRNLYLLFFGRPFTGLPSIGEMRQAVERLQARLAHANG